MYGYIMSLTYNCILCTVLVVSYSNSTNLEINLFIFNKFSSYSNSTFLDFKQIAPELFMLLINDIKFDSIITRTHIWVRTRLELIYIRDESSNIENIELDSSTYITSFTLIRTTTSNWSLLNSYKYKQEELVSSLASKPRNNGYRETKKTYTRINHQGQRQLPIYTWITFFCKQYFSYFY